MFYKFNDDEFKISEFDDGKIITELKTSESYYLDEISYNFLFPLINNWKSFDEIISNNSEVSNVNEFLDLLVNKRILLTKENFNKL
jgi:hypothetical protein